MTNSILFTTKKLLGISEEYHAFDIDIVTNINAVFMTLNQLGIGPRLPYQLSLVDETLGEETWDDFLGEQKDFIAAVQTYVYQRVRLLFDPPTNSFLVDAIQKSIEEFEWRFTVQPKSEAAVETVESYKTEYGDTETPDETPDEGDEDLEPEEPDPDVPTDGDDISLASMQAYTPRSKPTLFDIFS